MGRRVSLVSLLLIVGLVAGALPAPGQETPSTWGRVKQLYTQDADLLRLGAGVSPGQADAALSAVRSQARLPYTGPMVVRLLARSDAGRILVLYTRTANGVEAAHLVSGEGGYIRGVEMNPESHVIRDAVTGERLGRFDPGDLPEEFETTDWVQQLVRRASSIACNATATIILEKCLAFAVPVSPFPGSLSCVATAAAFLLACEALVHMHYQLEDPEFGDPGLEYQPGDSTGG